MILWHAVQGSAGATLPFTPSSVSDHNPNERLTLHVVGLDPVSSAPDTPTATNGWQLVKSYLDVTTGLFLYSFAIQATSTSMAAPQIAFPGSTPTATAWVMTTYKIQVSRYWKDPIGGAGNDGTTYGDWILPVIANGTQYSHDHYPLVNNWFGGGMTAVFGMAAVPTDSPTQLDIFNSGIYIYNVSGGQTGLNAGQYAETSAGGGLAAAWMSRQNFSGNPVENANVAMQFSPSTAMDGLVVAVLMREDTVPAPVAPMPATGTASLGLSAANGTVATSSLSLSASYEVTDGKTWLTAKPFVPGAANTMAMTQVTEFGTSRPFNHAWWKYTAPTTTTMTLNTFATVADDYNQADTLIQVYNQTTEPSLGSYIASGDDVPSPTDGHVGLLSEVTFDVIAGTTYHFLVGTYSSGFLTITTYALSAPPPPPDPGGTWETLDLSLTEFMYNPAIPGTPFGEWNGGRIQPLVWGSNQIVFEHPDLRLEDLNPFGTYQVEVTYGVGTVWTSGYLESRPLVGASSYWNDPGREIGQWGGFNTTGFPVSVHTFGMNSQYYRNDWILSNNAGDDALLFAFTSQVYITQIRVRELASFPIASASATLSLGATALYDAPPPTPLPSPLILDTTPAFNMGVATKVGSGNVLNDGNDGTYFQLNGLGYFPENIGSLNAGYILVPIPALPGLVSITSLMLNIRAEFYGIAGSPTNASLWVSIGEETAVSPLIFNSQYAYLVPGNNYPVIPLGSIQNLHYELEDWNYATLGYPNGLDSPLAAATLTALRTGTAQLIISPRYHFNDSNVAHRIQGKFYEVNMTMVFEIGTPPVEEPLPGLPSGYTEWQDLDLSTALFYRSGAPDTSVVPATPTGYAFGRYDPAADRILRNTPLGGYPDFSIPGFEMDVEKDYYFQFVFDSLDVRDDHSQRDVWLWLARPEDPHRSYYEEPYGDLVLYQSENSTNEDFHMFHLDPAAAYHDGENWGQLANGFTLPIFETRPGTVLAAIRYATREDGYLPPEPYSPPEKARANFWGQQQ